jgi:hypothetical protein
MILIDLDADLNMEDDDGPNFSRIPKSADQPRVGSVLVAGRPQFWSWVVIDEVDGDIAYFHQVSAKQAASIGPLVAGVPTVV